MKNILPRKKIFYPGFTHLLDILFYGYFKKPFRVCVDITNKCTLECETCYWRKDIKKHELNDKEWVRKIDKVLEENPSIMQGVWMGGEPMLRYNLIRKLASKFTFNQVFTNGTVPIKPIPKTRFTVSIDGTRKYHNKLRKNSYDLVKKNILDSEVTSFSVIFLISKINKSAIKKFAEEWSSVPKVSKIIFTFYNPNVGESNKLWISFEERDEIINEIQKLGKIYPKVKYPAKHLFYFLKKNHKKTVKECWRTHHYQDIHLDSMGNRKIVNLARKKGYDITCGTPETDCYRCGADILARSVYMSKHRFEYLVKLARSVLN